LFFEGYYQGSITRSQPLTLCRTKLVVVRITITISIARQGSPELKTNPAALFSKPSRAAFARSFLPSTSGCAWMMVGRGIIKMRILGIVALGAALGGCASSSADITPSYVSPVAYQTYTCQQLALEAQSISTRAATLSGAQDSQRTKDGWATAAAVVVFWPAAFFVGGDKQTAAELAQMKGQMVAVEQASIAKKCGIQFQGPRPPGT
jgi:hypothetical protein